MALEQRDVERLANEARALELLRILDAALADTRKLTQDIIKSAKE